ncbi:MAG: 50S ribosomal protein L4 [Alphaproteobacteria bacterium]|nr:50S ribosomal protein L4 [Alphaproteobacteria bacterium]MBL6954093.1 50S ribosomal protein L4 [Alphaproteobacteria bacterium]
MQAKVTTLDNKSAGSIELAEAVFGVRPRRDILHRVVIWQLAKRREGNHATKERHAIKGSGGKIWAQKGTGRARHSSRKAPQFRGGGVAHGPRVHDHEHKLTKKVRALGLRSALSAKQAEGKLVILDTAALAEAKTRALTAKLSTLGWSDVLIIDGGDLDPNLVLAAGNLAAVQVMASAGANVYDILRRDTLVLTKSAVEILEARLA